MIASSVHVSPYDPHLYDSLNPLLPSAAGETLTDDSWIRHQSLSTAISLGIFSLTFVCDCEDPAQTSTAEQDWASSNRNTTGIHKVSLLFLLLLYYSVLE